MPYFSIDTNQTLEEASTKEIMKKASSMIAGLLGKAESVVMVSLKPGTLMTFAGTDEPTAFASLKSIGLTTDQCPELSEKICGFIGHELGIPKGRIFIDFKNLEGKLFGWDGRTL